MKTASSSVAITGGAGGIGTKLARYFIGEGLRTSRRFHIKLIDDYDGYCQGAVRDPLEASAVEREEAVYPYAGFVDLSALRGADSTIEHVSSACFGDGAAADLAAAFDGVDAVIHLQAFNPYPEASWEDSAKSMAMSANVVGAAEASGVSRLILASSNHVMGRRIVEGAHDGTHEGGDGRLSAGGPPIAPWTQPLVGTQFNVPGYQCDATPYAAAKLAAEEMARAAVQRRADLSAAALRIGWCQPEENHPRTMSVTGTPTLSVDGSGEDGGSGRSWATAEAQVAEGYDNRNEVLKWFQLMWLSNRDMGQLFLRAVDYVPRDASEAERFMVVNGNSRNTGRRWTADNFDAIGYVPEDDVTEYAEFKLPG